MSNRSDTSPSLPSSASWVDAQPVRRLQRLTLLAAGLAGLILLAGCSDTKVNDVVVKLFEPRKTPQQNMLVAFASEDADLRRAALAKVATSKLSGKDWAVKGYVAIALLDNDPQSRCVAIRALVRTADEQAPDVVLKLLNYREFPPQEVRPPDGLVRWDATDALATLSANGQIPDEQQERARTTLIDRLRLDTSRYVRIAAARGLGYYPHEDSVKVLVERLRDEDFAVTHECELSLVRLTGTTHDCDALAWEQWVADNHENLFAEAGEVPESRRPPYRGPLGKMSYNINEFVRWLVPGSKEK